MTIVWRAQAEADIEALTQYIAIDNPKTALRIYDIIVEATYQLSIFPNLGRIGRVGRTRELVISHLPYIVIYTIIKQEIQILAIFHTSRKWPKSFPEK